MGCASSKSKVCRKCKGPFSPVRRSISLHDNRRRSAARNYTVSLTSSTLGSLNLDGDYPVNRNQEIVQIMKSNEEFAISVVEAQTWSEMIDQKIPKIVPRTPIITPPGEPESINAWELMEGLEDTCPLQLLRHFRSFSVPVSSDLSTASIDDPTVKNPDSSNPNSASKPNSNDTTLIRTDFDPYMIKSTAKILPAVNDRLILYFTSLRGVRRTYEDCCNVRMLLKGLRVKIDGRDVSMHSRFKEELKELLGDQLGNLPRVFFWEKVHWGD